MNLIRELDQLQKEINDLKEKVLYFINKVKDYDDAEGWGTEIKIDTETYFIKRFEDFKSKISGVSDELQSIDSSVKKLSNTDVFNEEIFKNFLLKDIYTKGAWDPLKIIELANKTNFEIKKNINLLSQKYKMVENVTSIEWDKIASTLAHTLKGPSNLIFRKSKLLLEDLDSKKKGIVLSIIDAADYSNKIIKLFDILRSKLFIETELVDFKSILGLIRDSEDRIFELAEFGESKLGIESLERIAGEKYPVELKEREIFKKNISLIKNNYDKSLYDLKFRINKVALSAIFDELILNMYRYARNKNATIVKDLNALSVKTLLEEKPEIFNLEINQINNDVVFRFLNGADSTIYNFSETLNSQNYEGSLPNQSFGIYFMKMFSTDGPNKNLQFYKLTIPRNTDFSEIIFSFNVER